jgi:hypothetical protein
MNIQQKQYRFLDGARRFGWDSRPWEWLPGVGFFSGRVQSSR